MQPQDIILLLGAIVVGVHSWEWRNPTAVALVLAYVAAQGGLPLEYYGYSDAVVILVIMLKPSRSVFDKFILACYPAAWFFYIIDVSYSSQQWWHLFCIAMAQFIAVGIEPFAPPIRNYSVKRGDDFSNQMLVAYPAGGWSG